MWRDNRMHRNMTVNELIAVLQQYDGNMFVRLGGDNDEDIRCSRDIYAVLEVSEYSSDDEEYAKEKFIVIEDGGIRDPACYEYRK